MNRFFNTLKTHGFKGKITTVIDSNGELVYSLEYLDWLRYFPFEDLSDKWEWEEVAKVNFENPLGLEIRFKAIKGVKLVNMMQGLVQVLKDSLDIPNGMIYDIHYKCIGYCESEFDGEIEYSIYNI